jgi:hypothetical protein
MERAVYAVFASHDTAQSALHALLRRHLPDAVLGIQLHTGALHVDDLPLAATLARRWAVLAAIVLAAIGAWLSSIANDPGGVFFGGFVGALVGTLVAASSGRRMPKPAIGRLLADIERGRTIVTMDVTHSHVGVECEHFLQCHGALRVGMA